MRICLFEGLRQTGQAAPPTAALHPTPSSSSSSTGLPCRGPLRVWAEASKRSNKRLQVVLGRDVAKLGKQGTLTTVPLGYYRNHLLPKRLAGPATSEFLNRIKEEEAARERAAVELKAKATAMATALKTIGKFYIKKKAGEKDVIFGSVSPADIVAAIAQQTGRELDRRLVSFPVEPKALGTYECTVRLHPEVQGTFKVVVQREKQS